MRHTNWLLSIALGVFLAACSDDRVTLTVDAVTNIVPGAEFTRVETEVFRYSAGARGQGDSIASAVAEAHWGMPYAFGQRIASFERIGTGELMVRVRLRSTEDGSVLIERTVRITVSNHYSLRVYLERACVAVQCPGSGNAAYSECQAGQCVDPRCNPQDDSTRAFCPRVRFCNRETDCSPVSACAVRNCVDGICIPSESLPPVCNQDEWCDDARGCLPGGEEQPESLCGRLCFDENTPCSVGYWECKDGGRSCVELWRRSPGSECGDERVCVESGECVQCVEGADCRVGCRMGTVSCADGVPQCSVIEPTLPAPIGSACVDDSSYCYDVGSCPGSGECTEDGVCGPPSDPAVEIAPCDGDDTLAVLTDESGETDALCIRVRGLIRGDASNPGGLVQLELSARDESGELDATEISLSPPTLSFTRANASMSQRVTITGLDDAINDGDVETLVRVHVVGSSDARYIALLDQDVAGLNATVCPTGFAECNGVVEDGCEQNILTSPEACGSCDIECAFANAASTCVSGRCVMGDCEAGFSDCNGDPRDGCELEVGAFCEMGLGCRKGTWQCGTDPDTGASRRFCNITTIEEAGTPCGDTPGFVCDTVGECNTCTPGVPCALDGSPCQAGTTSCDDGIEQCVPNGLLRPTNSPCGDHHACSPSGVCEDILRTGRVMCGVTPRNANDLCRAADPRFSGALQAHGYSWGQCAGPLHPGSRRADGTLTADPCNGWSADGLVCEGTPEHPGFIGSIDCASMPFYYDPVTMTGPRWSFRITESVGDGSTFFDAPSLLRFGCNGWNPGWSVRLLCQFSP